MRRIALLAAIFLGLAACGGDVVSDPDEALPPNTGAEPPAEQPRGESGDPPPEAPTPRDDTVSELPGETSGSDNTTGSSSMEAPETEGPTDPSSFVASAIADLASRLGVPADDIEVMTFETVVWRTSALGCPQPGVGYLDVLTTGQRVILGVGGVSYHYHGGEDPFYCPRPEDPLPASADPNS